MSPPPYVEFEIAPATARAEPSAWDSIEWFDGDATLLGWSYGPVGGMKDGDGRTTAPIEATQEVNHG